MMEDVRKIFLCFVIIPFLLFVLPKHVTTENSICGFNWTVCAPRDQQSCHCSSDGVTDVIISCELSNLTNVNDIISTPEHVKRLDLSGNRIQRLSTGSFLRFTKMIYLSLASNSIHIISQGAFHGLDKVLQIDLSGNNITHWNTSTMDRELPNLQFLNVRENIFWIPDPTVLSLPRLQVISLLLTCMSKYDIRCYLVKHNTIRNADCNERQGKKHLKKIDNPSEIMRTDKLNELLSELTAVTCSEGKLMFRDSNFIDVSEDKGFRFQCEVQEVLNRKCFRPFNTTTGPKFYIGVADTCWSITGLIHIITTTAGVLALILNITVILTTLRSRILRQSVAHVLVANIAVGDLLVSFYLITVISTRQSMSEYEFHNLHVPYFCRVFGILFLIGQFSSSMLSFVMTLERYLAVVYCMRPQIRITMGTCLAVMAMVWGLSISIAVSFMTSKEFSTDTNHMCVPRSNENHTQVLTIVGGIGVLLYILSIALYGHMYLDFRRTHQKTVQLKRENRLARRIALILFTNVFFIILPLIISSAIKISALEDKVSSKDKSILWNTLAVTCLGVNSLLNPVLFSFRNEKFRTEFRKRLSPCNNSVDTQSES